MNQMREHDGTCPIETTEAVREPAIQNGLFSQEDPRRFSESSWPLTIARPPQPSIER
jgi:hypothetical protein